MPTKKNRDAGRPANSPNAGTGNLRNDKLTQTRVSQGFNETLKALKEQCSYKSNADVLHDAVQQLAYKKLPSTKNNKYWISKI